MTTETASIQRGAPLRDGCAAESGADRDGSFGGLRRPARGDDRGAPNLLDRLAAMPDQRIGWPVEQATGP